MIKLISVNIEHKKHLDRVRVLLDDIKPDVICMQEIDEDCVSRFAEQLGAQAHFAPMTHQKDGSIGGVALFSSLPVEDMREEYYSLSKEHLRADNGFDTLDVPMALVSATIEKEGKKFAIMTTHFMKTSKEGGFPDDFQFEKIKDLMSTLAKHEEVVVCGDFNAPRGMEIFAILAEKYKDNIDVKYTRSLDPVLHRRPDLELMVDGLFTTPHYEVTKMYFRDGVSDHYAIVAEIDKLV